LSPPVPPQFAHIRRAFDPKFARVVAKLEILKLGGQRQNLEFKVIGGGKVLDMTLDVGSENSQFVRDYLRREGFAIAAEDLGDDFARKLYYSPRSGKVRVKRLPSTVNRIVFEREQSWKCGDD